MTMTLNIRRLIIYKLILSTLPGLVAMIVSKDASECHRAFSAPQTGSGYEKWFKDFCKLQKKLGFGDFVG